jgi:hypothetical protein
MIRGDQWVEYLRTEFILVASDLGEMSRSSPENQEGGSKRVVATSLRHETSNFCKVVMCSYNRVIACPENCGAIWQDPVGLAFVLLGQAWMLRSRQCPV